jgi:hypothetical protein
MRTQLTIILSLCMVMGLSSCDKEETAGSDKYAFWQGAITNRYYTLDICGDPTGEIAGKPYMVLEYDPVSGEPISCEFGLSSAVFTALPRPNPTICLGSPPQPTMLASGLSYADRLSLTGSVDLMANWRPVTILSDLSGGGYDFNVTTSIGTLHFEHTNGVMTGEIVDEGQTGWGDAVSEPNAFNLLHKFNSNTISN